MKIAIPTRNDRVDRHFGHCEYFTIYSVDENNTISGSEIIESNKECGCKSGIASILSEKGVSLMLAGGIGHGAVNALNNSGIKVIRGCIGSISDVVMDYLSDKISDSGVSCLSYDQHHPRDRG